MRRKQRKPVYYTVTGLNDGTVMAAYPVRKPAARIMKRDGQKLDADNVCREFLGNYVGAFKFDDDGRFRFFDIMANRLNTRRAIRELILPEMQAVREEIAALRSDIRDRVATLSERAGR